MRAGMCMCFESTHCSTGPQPCSAYPHGIMAVRSSQETSPMRVRVGLVSVCFAMVPLLLLPHPLGRSSPVRGATGKSHKGLRPRDEWTPSALPRYAELLTANMLTTLPLRVKQRCRRFGSRPVGILAFVARVGRQTRRVVVGFRLVCDGT